MKKLAMKLVTVCCCITLLTSCAIDNSDNPSPTYPDEPAYTILYYGHGGGNREYYYLQKIADFYNASPEALKRVNVVVQYKFSTTANLEKQKYFDADSIEGSVTRLIPYETDSRDNRIYYEFMDFYRESQINYLDFTEEGSFPKLQEAVGKKSGEKWTDDEKIDFKSLYTQFAEIFESKKGESLGITAADGLFDEFPVAGGGGCLLQAVLQPFFHTVNQPETFGAFSQEGQLQGGIEPVHAGKFPLSELQQPLGGGRGSSLFRFALRQSPFIEGKAQGGGTGQGGLQLPAVIACAPTLDQQGGELGSFF